MNLPKMPFALIHSLFLDIDEGIITLNLQSYETYTALAEAESLLRLMIFTSKGFSYLALNMQNDYSNCTTFSEIIEKIEIKKKKKWQKYISRLIMAVYSSRWRLFYLMRQFHLHVYMSSLMQRLIGFK